MQLSYTAQLDYIDRKFYIDNILSSSKLTHSLLLIENYNGQGSVFFSRVNIESPVPFLLVEDIEHHLGNIICTESTIELHFATSASYDTAKKLCHELTGSYVVTSHDGCNELGARVPFQ
jgi:hypothetical protein